MKRVLKYPLFAMDGVVDDRVTLLMAEGAQVVGVGKQGRVLCLWAYVDPNAETVVRTFTVRGTGHVVTDDPIQPDPRYVGIVFDGAFVWHIFEEVA